MKYTPKNRESFSEVLLKHAHNDRRSKCASLYEWMKYNATIIPPELWIKIIVIISRTTEKNIIEDIRFKDVLSRQLDKYQQLTQHERVVYRRRELFSNFYK
jgi:hypothetical protein